jgi:hypothetical protein
MEEEFVKITFMGEMRLILLMTGWRERESVVFTGCHSSLTYPSDEGVVWN